MKEENIALHFDRVTFSYGERPVLKDASFHIHEGEFVALVGPNGSGKTTVLKLILGIETPFSGRIEIFGRTGKNARSLAGYVPQQTQTDAAFPVTVREVVAMGRLHIFSRRFRKEDREAVDEALEQAEITELAERQFSELSGGQKRRVLTARALAVKAGLLILDEPTANMDTESEERLYGTLEKIKGKAAILIVTHDTGFVSSLNDRVLCMGMSEGSYGIVQHRLGESEVHHHEAGKSHAAARRVLHEETLPGDACNIEGEKL